MEGIIRIDSVHDFNQRLGAPDVHPHVSVIDFSAGEPRPLFRALIGVYGIFIREDEPQNVIYGTRSYDFQGGTLIALSPGQLSGAADTGEPVQREGWALLFDAEILRGTSLEGKIRRYSFFSYDVHEALHMKEDERTVIADCMTKLKKELEGEKDSSSRDILVSYIELILNYCQRFYNRQFNTRTLESKDYLARFERVLANYYAAGEQERKGLPTVQLCADRLSLSPSYFSDLVSRETGVAPKEHIQHFLIDKAKALLAAGQTVSEAAYQLGFNYPHHLSRLFKKAEGISPSEYVEALHR